jgi:DNA-binding GntR family transcriptional regulator
MRRYATYPFVPTLPATSGPRPPAPSLRTSPWRPSGALASAVMIRGESEIGPPSARSVETVVHDRMREAILMLELEPGLRIDSDALSARFDTTVEVLTEVVHALAQEGLVAPRSDDGVVVIAPMSLDDLIELYTLRVVGEADAMWHTVPVLSPAACDQLAGELRRIDRHGPSPEGHAAHRRFHDGLRAGVGTRRRRELSQLFDHAQRYSLAAGRRKVDRGPAEHRAILRTCFNGERRLATQLVMRHCADTAYELIELQDPGRRVPSLDAAIELLSERFDSLV